MPEGKLLWTSGIYCHYVCWCRSGGSDSVSDQYRADEHDRCNDFILMFSWIESSLWQCLLVPKTFGGKHAILAYYGLLIQLSHVMIKPLYYLFY